MEDKIKQATKEIRAWAKEPGRAIENPTEPKAVKAEGSETITVEAPTDIYEQSKKTQRKELEKRRPYGSSTAIMAVVRDAVAGGDGREGLARAYKRVEGYSELPERKEILEQQYMEEQFLPVVEAVVNFTSPDEVLNNKEALRTLDQYAVGVGSGAGYTEAYIRQAYGNTLGQVEGNSDQAVRDAVMNIKRLADMDQIRTAVSLANNIKSQIDKGSHIASDEDYTLIARVASYK